MNEFKAEQIHRFDNKIGYLHFQINNGLFIELSEFDLKQIIRELGRPISEQCAMKLQTIEL